jgi:hypothetical protein
VDYTLQLWLIVISLALLASIILQLFLVSIFIRPLSALRPKSGQRSLAQIADRAYETIEDADGAIRATVDMLMEAEPVVSHAASASGRQIMRADQVIGDALDGVARIQQDVRIVRNWPIREARALHAGMLTTVASPFRTNGTVNEGHRW